MLQQYGVVGPKKNSGNSPAPKKLGGGELCYLSQNIFFIIALTVF